MLIDNRLFEKLQWMRRKGAPELYSHYDTTIEETFRLCAFVCQLLIVDFLWMVYGLAIYFSKFESIDLSEHLLAVAFGSTPLLYVFYFLASSYRARESVNMSEYGGWTAFAWGWNLLAFLCTANLYPWPIELASYHQLSALSARSVIVAASYAMIGLSAVYLYTLCYWHRGPLFLSHKRLQPWSYPVLNGTVWLSQSCFILLTSLIGIGLISFVTILLGGRDLVQIVAIIVKSSGPPPGTVEVGPGVSRYAAGTLANLGWFVVVVALVVYVLTALPIQLGSRSLRWFQVRIISNALRWFPPRNPCDLASLKYDLAQMYLEGESLPHRPAEALRLFRESAMGGSAQAQFLLGKLHYDCLDYEQAVAWLNLAVANASESEKVQYIELRNRSRSMKDSAALSRTEYLEREARPSARRMSWG